MAFDLTARLRLRDEMSRTLRNATVASSRLADATRQTTTNTSRLATASTSMTSAAGRQASAVAQAATQTSSLASSTSRASTTQTQLAQATSRTTTQTNSNSSAVSRNRGALSGANSSAINLVKTLGTLAAAYVTVAGATKLFNGTIGAAANYEASEIAIKAIFNDNKKAAKYLEMVEKKALDSPVLNSTDMMAASKGLIAMTKDVEQLEQAWSIVEKLQVLDPTQGTEGAAFALKEMWQGDNMSLTERFGLNKKESNRIKKLPIAEQNKELNKLLNKMGITEKGVAQMGSTTLGVWSQIGERAEVFFRKVGSDGNSKLNKVLTDFLATLESMDLDALARRFGDVLGSMVQGLINVISFVRENKRVFEQVFSIIGLVVSSAVDSVKRLLPVFEQLVGWIDENKETILPLVKNFLLIAGTYAVVAKFVDLFKTMKDKIVLMISAVRGGSLLTLMNPWALAITGIIILIALIVKNWDKIKPVIQKVIDAVTPYVESFIEQLKVLWEKVKVGAKIVKETFKKIWKSFQDSAFFKELTAAFDELVRVSKIAFDKVSSFVGGFFSIFKGDNVKGTELLKKIGFSDETIKKLIEIIDFLRPVLDTFFKVVVLQVATTAKLIWNILKLGFSLLRILFTTNLIVLWNSLKVAFTVMYHIVKITFTLIVAAIRLAWSVIKTVFSTAFDVLIAVVSTAIGVIKGTIDLFIAVFTGDWRAAWQAIKDIFSSIWTGIMDTLSAVLIGLTNLFSDTWAIISETFTKVFSQVKDFFIDTINAIVDAASTTWASMTDLLVKPIEMARDALEGIVGTIHNWFDSLMSLAGSLLEKIGVVKSEKATLSDEGIDGSHRFGRSTIPFDGYRAELHKGERVLTKQENKAYTNGGSGSGSVSLQFGNIIIDGASNDPEKMADQFLAVLARRLKEADELGSI